MLPAAQNRIDFLGGVIAQSLSYVAVDIEREGDRGMAKPFHHGPGVSAGREQLGRVGMPQAVEMHWQRLAGGSGRRSGRAAPCFSWAVDKRGNAGRAAFGSLVSV
jgi:hypothetical protein